LKEIEKMKTTDNAEPEVRVERFVPPHIVGPIAESYMVQRTHDGNREWLTPERTWDRAIFEAARFELDEYDKALWWLNRELSGC
jgi:hypothetical protein